jgi:hypothetical protein
MPRAAFLTRESLEDAFRTLGVKARAADKVIEIAVYGGSALVLTLPGRVATKDVDAVFPPGCEQRLPRLQRNGAGHPTG